MPAYWSGPVAELLSTPLTTIAAQMALQQNWHVPGSRPEQVPAWTEALATLRSAMAQFVEGARWHVLLEYPILRLGKRIDAVLLAPRAIFVLEFKREQADAAAHRQAEDYALDLFDFHEHSRAHPVVPILVSGGARPGIPPMPLFHGVAPVLSVRPDRLRELLAELAFRAPHAAVPLDAEAWLRGAYRPVPTIVEAACMAYARNGVAELAEARADPRNLRETTAAIWTAIAAARAERRRTILFVTGIPGAGKTLCGLNAAFAPEDHLRGTFLTGNPTLVHVLREALVRDATEHGRGKRRSERALKVIQRLPDFRNDYLEHPDRPPAEPVIVIDEAQRCWSRAHAERKTRDRPVRLTDSEPGHLLDIMARRPDFAVIVCMIGSGQEIHDGEGGLAEWGTALRARPEWQVLAAPDTAEAADPRQLLGELCTRTHDPALHLQVPIRQVRGIAASRWVDAVLHSDARRAAAIAGSEAIPFAITRCPIAWRRGLRHMARGTRRAGLVASSGGARLRAIGLGSELPHMDAQAVAHWFLDHFPPDVRASDALEQVATEFSVQGLELDYVGLCWDTDLARDPRRGSWQPRRFSGTAWQTMRASERIANRLNTYRVLLTRARYFTIILVPQGDPADPTREPATYDAIAAYLSACGVPALDDASETEPVLPAREEMLL